MPIKIDAKKCIGCGACIAVCPEGVIEMVKGKAKAVNLKKCKDCKTCVSACPVEAIRFSKR